MLSNIGDIYNYLNTTLMKSRLTEITEVIEFFEEFQQIIASTKGKIPADELTFTLTTNSFSLPNDFQALRQFTVDDYTVIPTEIWKGTVTLPTNITSGTAKLKYYKKPTALDSSDLTQVPDIDSRYYYAMAKYAAEMFWLAKDDPDRIAAFRQAFFDSLTRYASYDNTITNFFNTW